MNSLISVIIPTYNSAETIGTAIQSILDQTYSNLEIIVVDDNSIDNTKSVVERFKDSRIKYYALPCDDPHRFNWRGANINAGWMARNYGFEKVKGDWVTFQDADDASFLNRIEVQYGMAQKYNSSHVCIHWQKFNENLLGKLLDIEKYVIVSSEEILKLAKKTKGSFWRSQQWTPYPYCASVPMVKREIIDKVKFRPLSKRVWPSKGGRGADRDFNFQVAETFKNSISLKIPLYLWRTKT